MRVLLAFAVFVTLARGQSASTDAFLNSLDLNLSQYNARMGMSAWIFNQNMAQLGMGSRDEVVARGRARIRSGQASVTYRPVADTMAEEFAASRGNDLSKRREVARTYNEFLSRFRAAQHADGIAEHDVAGALGLAFASYYEIYSGGKVANADQDRDIAAQFRQALLKDEYFQGTTDRYRQLLAENTAVQVVAALIGYRSASKQGDRASLDREREGALAFLDFYWPGDVDRARKIRLTAQGFRD